MRHKYMIDFFHNVFQNVVFAFVYVLASKLTPAALKMREIAGIGFCSFWYNLETETFKFFDSEG
jgi:hypothetical protein